MCDKNGAKEKAKGKPETQLDEPVIGCANKAGKQNWTRATPDPTAQKSNVLQQQQQQRKKPDPKIISVEFLNGGDDVILSGEGMQYVNMPAEDKWVDGNTVKNKDRLSATPRIKVKFDQKGTHTVKVKLVPGGSNTTYTNTEKSRNAKFKYEETEKTYTTGADGTLIISDMKVAISGNDVYSVRAKDAKGTTLNSTGKIKTGRLFYVVEIKMQGLAGVATSIDTLTSEFQSNFMTVKKLAAVQMDHMSNISNTDENTFQTKARTAYAGSEPAKNHEPYCVAIGYTDHLAVKNPNKKVIKDNVDVGPGKAAVEIPIVGPGLTNPDVKTKYLWKNLVPGEDWFVSCKYLKNGGAVGDIVNIDKAKCVADPADMSAKVTVSVDHLPAGKGTITLEVNWVDRMRGGLSFSGGNLICVCAKSWWRTKDTASQNQVMIHELGHKVYMVSDGTGKLPDAVPTLYTSAKGHVGNHCYKGNADGQTRYDSSTDAANSTCVMYGATNGKTAFCANCKPALRKMDISDGWSRF